MILEATCSKVNRCDLQVVPVLAKLAKPEVMTAEQGTKLFERLTQISMGAKVDHNGKVQLK
ncbi:hypothetical protein D3C85_1870630 [compost metagenome]